MPGGGPSDPAHFQSAHLTLLYRNDPAAVLFFIPPCSLLNIVSMRLIHFADLHLGVENYGRPDPQTGLSTRLADFLRVFDELVDYALSTQADLVLFCGDAYKSREPTPTQQREFARRINRLVSNGVAVFLLVGNHDLPNAVGKATATEIFDTLSVKNVYVSARPAVHRIETKSGPVQIASLPWPRRSMLLSKDESRDLDLQQIQQKIEASLTRIIDTHAAHLDPALPAVLAAHVMVTDCKVGSERTITIGQDHSLMRGVLANPAFDYVALGHVHKQQVLSVSPPVVYAGSLERLDFGEEDDEKGFYVVDITQSPPRHVRFDFHPVKARRFVRIELDVSADDLNPAMTVMSALARERERIADSVVRVSVNLPASAQGFLKDGEIREALAGAYHATVARQVKEEQRVRLGNLTGAEMAPLDALRVWLETKNVDPERKKLLMDHAERMLTGQAAPGSGQGG